MNDLLKEFEDDMRRERSAAMWKSFGRYVVWLSIAIVLGTTLGVSWRYWQKSQNMKRTSELVQAQELIDAGDYKKAASVLGELANRSDADMYGLVMLRKAHALEQAGEKDAAKAAYAELAGHTGEAVAPYAALAGMSSAQKDALSSVSDKNDPFYYSRMEWRGWQLVDKGETPKAVEIFTALLDDGETPPTLRGRVTEALQVLAPEALLPKIANDETKTDESHAK